MQVGRIGWKNDDDDDDDDGWLINYGYSDDSSWGSDCEEDGDDASPQERDAKVCS